MLIEKIDELKLCNEMILERKGTPGMENTVRQLEFSRERILEDIDFYINRSDLDEKQRLQIR